MGIPAIDPASVGPSGLAWLLISYGYVLYAASNLISEGSDLLLLVPSLAGLVGGVVLPLLGAVPDGAIMLFSGLGDVDEAQETLSVGVGALAGSTIMLLTVPWALSIWSGRVDFGADGMPNYKGSPKLNPDRGMALSDTGVALTPEIHHGARMMILTTLPYFLIQIPALFLKGDRTTVSAGEHSWALGGFCLCMFFFVAYLYTQVKMSNDAAHKTRRMQVIKSSLKAGTVSLRGALADDVQQIEKKLSKGGAIASEDTPLNTKGNSACPSKEVTEYLKGILGDAFRGYDDDRNGTLSKEEFRLFLTDFNESISEDNITKVFSQFDKDNSNTIDYSEFICACYVIISSVETHAKGTRPSDAAAAAPLAKSIFSDEGDAAEEEEEEVPEDLTDLSPAEQQATIKRRAFTMLFAGTALVLLFSDPMVDVMSEVAVRLDIPAFYVSFILAPLASNASEVIASQYYAAKKTRKTITVSLTALEGAASMNNTLCLSIFMALIYFRGLAWQYSAETLAIVLVQVVVAAAALREKMSMMTALAVLSLFPLSVAFVALLEHFGLD